MARFRARRRFYFVWKMMMTFMVGAVGLLTLLLLWEEPLNDVDEGFAHRPSSPFYSSRRTLQEDGDRSNHTPHLVLQDEGRFQNGSSQDSRRGQAFWSTSQVVAGDPRDKDDHHLHTNEYKLKEMGQRISTPAFLGTLNTSVSNPSTEDTPLNNQVAYLDHDNTSFLNYYYDDYGLDNFLNYSFDDYDFYNIFKYLYDDYRFDNISNFSLYDNDYPTIKFIAFTRSIFLCEYIYSAVYGEYTILADSAVSYGNSSLYVITGERFLEFCVPFLKAFNDCEERDVITICHAEDVVFVHLHNCQKPSSEDLYFDHLLVATRLEEDDGCFQAVCEGSLRVVERKVDGVVVRLISPNVTSCHRYLLKYYQREGNETKVRYHTRNQYWPCCFPEYDVVWMGEPEALASVAKDWSYLPTRCRSGESFLVVMVTCIVIGGVMGNLLVVIILVRHGFKDTTSTMIRMSLALADLLLSLFVLAPSLNEHIHLIHNTDSFQPSVDGGFQVFSALMMSLCCITSQLNLFALSLERLIFASGIAQRSLLFTRPRMRGFIIVTWTLSLLVSLVLMSNGDGMIVGLRYSFNKLIIGSSPRSTKILLPSAMALLAIVCLLTGGFSVQAVRKHFEGKAQRAIEVEEGTETDLDQGGDQSCHSTVNMVLTAVFYIGSTLMGGLACVLHLSAARFAHVELICYLCWWVFLGSPAWNPWLYNLPSQQFRNYARAYFSLLVPRNLFSLRLGD
ncbi:uncharacterized protein [Panulirus ornatus]|uniref:uncharacterized protein n=1 Tax=Panulirus ornatus TaxID=150431 RepID=UPI003A88061B